MTVCVSDAEPAQCKRAKCLLGKVEGPHAAFSPLTVLSPGLQASPLPRSKTASPSRPGLGQGFYPRSIGTAINRNSFDGRTFPSPHNACVSHEAPAEPALVPHADHVRGGPLTCWSRIDSQAATTNQTEDLGPKWHFFAGPLTDSQARKEASN